MDALNIQFAPATGTEKEWNEAYARLSDYFRSYRLHNRIRRTQLILETLQHAAKAHQLEPQRKPTAHAIEQARLMLHNWLGKIYADLHMTEAQIEASGRLGFHLAGGPDSWPSFFLDNNNLPADMTEAMRLAVRTSGPRMNVSKMTPRDIDLGLTHTAEETLGRFEKQPWLRYLFLAAVVAIVLSYVYRILA
jgi:hypothetical protein